MKRNKKKLEISQFSNFDSSPDLMKLKRRIPKADREHFPRRQDAMIIKEMNEWIMLTMIHEYERI